MPRAGLTGVDVVASAAGLADEVGYGGLTMGLLADRLGVRPPSLYKHVDGLGDLQHRLATLAMTEFGDVLRDAVQGQAGLDALTAMLTAARAYVTAHPGRYAATTGAGFDGPGDPLLVASTRVINTIGAVLRGYGVSDAEMNHAIRTIRCTLHGFAMLEASGGFQWDADPDQSFDWMIRFIDRGLRSSLPGQAPALEAPEEITTASTDAAGSVGQGELPDSADQLPPGHNFGVTSSRRRARCTGTASLLSTTRVHAHPRQTRDRCKVSIK